MDLSIKRQTFLKRINHCFAARFDEKPWMLKVCYLNDVFNKVNELKTSMQGRDQNIIVLSEKILAFKEKLNLWKTKMIRGKTGSFSLLSVYFEQFEDKGFVFDTIKAVLVENLEK